MIEKFEIGKLQKRLRWLYLCFALVTVLLAVFPMEAFADALTSVKSMGTTAVTDIAATQDGKLLYVTESSSSPIYRMNADGSNAAALGSQTFMFPKYLFVDHSNNIFVLDFQSTSWNSARITKLNSSGSILWQSNYLDITNYSIMDMAAFDNYVYLVDTSYKVLRIYSYNSSTGNLDYVNGIGGMFAGDEPYYPNGVTVRWNPATSVNEVYITDVRSDVTNGRKHGVFKMNATGGNITEVNKNVDYISPSQVAADDNGNVYFVDGSNGVHKINPAGSHTYILSAPHSASDITVSPSGQVYVTCYDTSVTPTVYDITRLALTPVVSGLSVASGPVTGGTSVTINGTGFTGTTAVLFGGTAASSFSVNSDTTITATAPARSGGTLGPVHIIVTAPGGTSTTNSSDQFTYTPGPAVSLTVSATGTQTAGTSFTLTVTAKDQYGNTATGYRGIVHFTTNNGNSPNGTAPSLPGNYTFTAGDAGTHTFNNAVLYNKAVSTISAADTVTGSITGMTGNITVNAGAVNESNSIVMSGKASVLSDNADNTTLTVALKDAYNNPVNGKTVALNQDDGSSTFSPLSTVSDASGIATFTVKSTKAETVTYTVMVNSAATGLTRQVTFTPGTAVSLSVSAAGIQTAGTSFPVTVTAKDQYGNTATGYTGTVHFTTTNGNSPNGTAPSLPSDYTFTAGDAGTHTFNNAVLYNKAASTITAADTVIGSIAGVTGNIAVNAGAADESYSAVMAGKTSVTADNADNTTITVTLKDAYNNPIDGKTVSLDKGSGSSTISPASTTSGADGTATFTVKSIKAENVIYTVRVNAATTGLTSQVTFTPGSAAYLTVSAGTIQTAGTAFTVTVTAIDQNGNIAAGYTGAIHFTTTNPNSPNGRAPSLPQDYTFTAGDGGTHTFSNEVTLYNASTSVLTAADTNTPAITGATGSIGVEPGSVNAVESSVIADKQNITADDNDSAEITVTLKDSYGNPVSGRKVTLEQKSGSVNGSSEITTGNDISDGAGTVTFTVKSQKAEEVTFTASASGVEIDQESVITFLPGLLKSFKVEAGGIQIAGEAFGVTVTAQDQFGNTVTDYRGTVSFSTNNGSSPGGEAPSLPQDYTFIAGDGGTHTFSNESEATLYNAAVSTLTATDSEDQANIITGSTQSITVHPGAVDEGNSSVAVSDSEITADGDDSATITVRLKDEYGNPVIGKNVTLTGGGSSQIDPDDEDSDVTGTVHFTVTSTRAEVVDYTAEAEGTTITETVQVTFVHGEAKGLTLSIPNGGGQQTAGATFDVTVTIKDADGNTVTDYEGTVSFSTDNGSSPDGTEPSLPSDYIFTLQDEGSHTFSNDNGVILYNATSCGLTVAGDVYQVRADTTRSIMVIHGSVDKDESTVSVSSLQITANNTDSTTITVVLKDAYGNPIEGMPVTLTQNGSSTILPAGALSDVHGAATFTVKSKVAENVSYTAQTGGINISQKALVDFIPGDVAALKVVASKTQTAGGPFDVTVTALDQYENIAEGYTGTVHFSSNNGSSPGGTPPSLPQDYTFTEDDAGIHIFHNEVTLHNAAESTCTVTGTTDGSITGTTENITINPGAVDAGSSLLAAGKVSATADNLDSITVTAALKDAYGNPVSGRNVTLEQKSGSVNGSSEIATGNDSSDGAGTVTFTVKSQKAEEVTFTASAGGITITQTAQVTFMAGPIDAARSTVTVDKTVVTNDGVDSADITVILKDTYDNPVSGKTVTLSQSSGNSVITAVGAVTGATGAAVFTVTDTALENVTYTAAVNGIAITQTASVSFLQKHTVSVSVNPVLGGTVTGGGIYHEGTQVTVTATANSGYNFVNWTEGTAVISTSSAFSFTLDIADRTLLANFSSTHSGGGNTAPPASDYHAALSGTGVKGTTLLATVDTDAGSAGISLGNLAGDVLGGEGTTVITVPAIPGVNAYTLEIPATSLSGSQEEGELTFTTEKGSITISHNMLEGIAGIGEKEAGITIEQGDKANLSDEIKAVLGDRPLIQLTLTLNGKQTEWNNLNAPAVVSIPYTPAAAELADPENIVVWYIDGAGNAVSVPNGHYDPETGTVVFSTTHFSDYAVGYNKVIFKDVAENAWYSDAVSFIAARGITTGTGNGNYSPKAKLTRGEFLVMLMRSYSIAPDTDRVNNFSDAGNTYYTGYLAAAKKLGISDGVGGNMFAPGKQISRQEMFTLLYNALKVIDQLPEGTEGSSLSAFSDADKIASWAKDAMTMLVETGTISGSGDSLSPTDITNRVQMAQVLYNLLSK